MSNLSTLFDRYKALVVFDTETSGLDFDSDQIIELAALRVERTATCGLRIAGKMDTFIKLPEGETLPENIVSLTGMSYLQSFQTALCVILIEACSLPRRPARSPSSCRTARP